MRNDHLVILLAEDDDGHAALVEKTLRRAGVSNQIVRVRDGQEALDFVRRAGAFAGRPPDPVLLLLDIRLPRVDGVGVLEALKTIPDAARVLVVMLTMADEPRDIDRCYQLGCRLYLTKPVRYEDFADALNRLGLVLKIIRVPSGHE